MILLTIKILISIIFSKVTEYNDFRRKNFDICKNDIHLNDYCI